MRNDHICSFPAWLRIHDLYHMLLKALSKQPKELFDFTDFVELSVPFFNRFFKLKFVYKLVDFEAEGKNEWFFR